MSWHASLVNGQWRIEVVKWADESDYHLRIYCTKQDEPKSPTRIEIRQAVKIWWNSFQGQNFHEFLNGVFPS